jgi:hypothetical protein
VGIDFQNASYDNAEDDTETEIIARFGMEWEATRTFSVIGEFGVGNPDSFLTGINVLF